MPFPASGGAKILPHTVKAIRFARHGCTNRPFLHLVVMDKDKSYDQQAIEQLGTLDPIPNMYGEQLCSLNLERIIYWIGEGADISKGSQAILGLAGLLPIHPRCYINAWESRQKQKEAAEKSEQKQSANIS